MEIRPHTGESSLWMLDSLFGREKEGHIAAVIAKPVRSTPYTPKPKYWKVVRNACDRHVALLNFNEIPHAPIPPEQPSPVRTSTQYRKSW